MRIRYMNQSENVSLSRSLEQHHADFQMDLGVQGPFFSLDSYLFFLYCIVFSICLYEKKRQQQWRKIHFWKCTCVKVFNRDNNNSISCDITTQSLREREENQKKKKKKITITKRKPLIFMLCALLMFWVQTIIFCAFFSLFLTFSSFFIFIVSMTLCVCVFVVV